LNPRRDSEPDGFPKISPIDPNVFDSDPDDVFRSKEEPEGKDRTDALGNDCGVGGSFDSHPEAEDEDQIQNNIQQGRDDQKIQGVF